MAVKESEELDRAVKAVQEAVEALDDLMVTEFSDDDTTRSAEKAIYGLGLTLQRLANLYGPPR